MKTQPEINRGVSWLEQKLRRFRGKTDVLFIIHNEMMYRHLRPVIQLLVTEPDTILWGCFPLRSRLTDRQIKEICAEFKLRIISYRYAIYLYWDLIVYPDHCALFRFDCPKVHTGHGLNSGKLVAGKPYKYGHYCFDNKGRIIYDAIFAANPTEKAAVENEFPELADRVVVVGNLFAEEVLSSENSREAILRCCGLNPRRKTLLISSTWGEYSIAQTIAPDLLNDIDEYLERFNVLLSLHPNNYVRDLNCHDWNLLRRSSQRENFYFLTPGEDSLRYLAAADYFVGDHSSVTMYFTLFGRPIVYYGHPKVRYAKNAWLSALQSIVPIVRDYPRFKKALLNGTLIYLSPDLKKLAGSIFYEPTHTKQRARNALMNLLKGSDRS